MLPAHSAPGKLLVVAAKSVSAGAGTAAQPPEAAIATGENQVFPDGYRLILAGNPVEKLPAGLYIVEVTCNEERATLKLVKQ